jgi:hypothetical protein
MFVQTFLAQPSNEAFHHCIVRGLAWSAEVQFKTSFISPFVHHLADELAATIGFDCHWFASGRQDVVQNPNGIFTF